jgi:hypothetical protein
MEWNDDNHSELRTGIYVYNNSPSPVYSIIASNYRGNAFEALKVRFYSLLSWGWCVKNKFPSLKQHDDVSQK